MTVCEVRGPEQKLKAPSHRRVHRHGVEGETQQVGRFGAPVGASSKPDDRVPPFQRWALSALIRAVAARLPRRRHVC